ncbi:protein-export chaperone SecB [Candidatus Thiodictyon syntrophicum]|jgi:preprotein translocase subunit SecB|uniref:Preprotein translocase subunit SecB n=1 Tax=Candidatus Thiodictyon syntrophicum TaxID=1166950 RepID=A0A2K8UJP3_9GAMM|nr:protein-export chaperone SecB [Candidatus Thiodictyon syntrophicum]AUB85699.1 hypothetical protein THSYN_32955 [Candidatus Thiodictyon syntrophicum]
MRPSIIQLRQLVFKSIHVEAVEPAADAPPGDATNFDFDGTTFRVELGSEALPNAEDDSDPGVFVVMLRIAIDNQEGKPAPYLFDITALGLIEIDRKIDKEKRSDLAAVNGASLIYGAIRELVTTLTARSTAGSFVLPTMDFREHLSAKGNASQDN